MTIILIILLFFSLLLSVFSYRRSNLRPAKKNTLLVIRAFLVICIFCAFRQPSFKITKLATNENSIPVLIDVSSSMQLFNTDSVLESITHFYKNYSKKYSDRVVQFGFFAFGDSLRSFQIPDTLTYKDKNSFFPRFINNNLLKKSSKILLLSDGNWSNTISSKHIINNKECYYIPLRQTVHPAYLHIETENRQHSVISDSQAVLTASINGYKSKNGTIDVTCRNKQKIISKKRVPVDSGFFNETIRIPINNNKAGITLYELNAQLVDDTIENTCYVLYDIAPKILSTYLYSAKPSLDRRFLTLALRRNKNWHIIKMQIAIPAFNICFFHP